MPGAKIVVCLIWRQWITGTMASSNLCWQIGQSFPDQDFKSEVSCNLVGFRARNLAESDALDSYAYKAGIKFLGAASWKEKKRGKRGRTEKPWPLYKGPPKRRKNRYNLWGGTYLYDVYKGVLPSRWKLKCNKVNHSPFSILPVLSKVIDKHVHWHL